MKKYTSIRLEITSKCNLNCEYCHNAFYNNKNDDMSTDDILKLITNLKEKYNIKKILITGGEPLVYKDVYKIISFISNLGIKVDLVTNGTLLNNQVIKKLEEAGLSRIRISIDDVSNNVNMRLNESFDKIWNVVRMIKSIAPSLELCIHTVCTPFNAENLFKIYERVLEVGARRWRVFELGFQGAITNKKYKYDFIKYFNDMIISVQSILNHYITNDLQSNLDIEINNIFRTENLQINEVVDNKFDFASCLEKRIEASPCDYVSDHQLTIRSSGISTLCQYYHNAIYDFKKYNYDVEKTIVNGSNPSEETILMKDVIPCANCKYCLVCNGGCRSRAEYLTGSNVDADPVACYLYERIYCDILPIYPKKVREEYYSYTNIHGNNPKYNEDDLKKILESKGY